VLKLANKAAGPDPGLLGGPSTQTYTYDAHDRVVNASGYAPQAPNKRRDYTYAVTYDTNGNITTKNQTDVISAVSSTGMATNPMQTQPETSYNWSFTYRPALTGGPHQIASAGGNTYSYDKNGNLAQIINAKNKVE